MYTKVSPNPMIDDYACILYYNSWVTLLVCGQLTQTVGGGGNYKTKLGTGALNSSYYCDFPSWFTKSNSYSLCPEPASFVLSDYGNLQLSSGVEESSASS